MAMSLSGHASDMFGSGTTKVPTSVSGGTGTVANLQADDDVNLDSVSQLVQGDMALAAAVMKAVNSSLYGLKGRVQTVHQAITYLGTREVVGIAYEMGLRAAFGPAAELEPLWQRAARRGYNPAAGKHMRIKAAKFVKFKAGKDLSTVA